MSSYELYEVQTVLSVRSSERSKKRRCLSRQKARKSAKNPFDLDMSTGILIRVGSRSYNSNLLKLWLCKQLVRFGQLLALGGADEQKTTTMPVVVEESRDNREFSPNEPAL